MSAGGADIALYVCAPVIAPLSRALGVQENRINRQSSAVGAQGETVQWGSQTYKAMSAPPAF